MDSHACAGLGSPPSRHPSSLRAVWQSEPVQPWVVVMIVVVVVAAALTVYGALSDRAKNRRRAAEMLGPPQRDIPNLPTDARSPAYVTEAQARRRPEGAPVDQPRQRGRDEPATARANASWTSATPRPTS